MVSTCRSRVRLAARRHSDWARSRRVLTGRTISAHHAIYTHYIQLTHSLHTLIYILKGVTTITLQKGSAVCNIKLPKHRLVEDIQNLR